MQHPRMLALASVEPPYTLDQAAIVSTLINGLYGPRWEENPEAVAQHHQLDHAFKASRVERRQFAADLVSYYQEPRSTGDRMALYAPAAQELGRAALEACLRQTEEYVTAADITDFVAVTCTGYTAPGLDILLARDLEMARDVRRVVVGHMGCYGAMVGLRQCLTTLRAYPDSTAALLSVELCGLHFKPTLDVDSLTAFSLFGDASAAMLLGHQEGAPGPALVDAYSAADFGTTEQMTWYIGDSGFDMHLSPRVPITLRRNVQGVVEHLLDPHGLHVSDIAHWVVHPGGPSILEVVQQRLELSDEQMAPSWRTLANHGNCSSATVLLILEDLLRTRQPKPGEWCVMMAFGPGLTLETALWQF
jgi:alkylresorcinol/alkylpyrone synthase